MIFAKRITYGALPKIARGIYVSGIELCFLDLLAGFEPASSRFVTGRSLGFCSTELQEDIGAASGI